MKAISKNRSYTVAILAASMIVLSALNSQAQTRPFEAIPLGTVTELGGLSNTFPITAVGQELRNGRVQAFVFKENQTGTQAIPLAAGDPASSSSRATDVSASTGEVVGESNGSPTDWVLPCAGCNPIQSSVGHYPNPAGCFAGADVNAVNDSRVAVGSCQADLGGFLGDKAIRWSVNSGQFTATALPTGPIEGTNLPSPGRALDVGNSGLIVGQQGNNAAVWTSPDQLPLVFNTLREARGVSNGSVLPGSPDFVTIDGQVNTNTPAGVQERGVTFGIFNGTTPAFYSITRLPFTYFGPAYPLAYQYLIQPFVGAQTNKINGSGQSVGHMTKRNNTDTVAAIWNLNGQFADLTANTSGLPAGTVLTDAVDINNQGFVLAKGLVNGQLQGFVLRPTGLAIPFTYGQYFY